MNKKNNVSFEKLVERPIAHRGYHNENYPENSLGAFENAIKNNYAIELDVRLLKDGKVVVFHDENLKRMCVVNKNIIKCTYSEIKDLKLGCSEYGIPTLEDVLNLVNGRVMVLIEIKSRYFDRKLENAVLKIVNKYAGDYAIQSFNPLSLMWFKKHGGNILRGYLSSFFTGSKNILKKMVKRLCFANVCDVNFVSYDFRNLPNKYVNRIIKIKKIPVLAYTIKNEQNFKDICGKVDNIIFEGFKPN